MRRSYESERRKRVWIGGAAGWRYVLKLVRLPSTVLVLAGCLVSWVLLRERSAAGTVPNDVWVILPGTLFVLLAAIGIVWTEAIRRSNRLCGPERNLCRAIGRIRTGDYAQRVRLRRGDELQALAEELNALLGWLEAHPPRVCEDDVAAETGRRDAC